MGGISEAGLSALAVRGVSKAQEFESVPFAEGSGCCFTLRCPNIAWVCAKRRAPFCITPERYLATTAAETKSDAAGGPRDTDQSVSPVSTNPRIDAAGRS